MLKKQTVWLLTMLSLMVVLSVYYMYAPKEGDFTYLEDDNMTQPLTNTNETTAEGITETDAENELISATNTDQYFTAVRLEVTNQRSMEKERLEEIVASSDTTSEEKSSAYEAMKEIEAVEAKEVILEEAIRASQGFDEVLVRNVEDETIVVTVKADSLSKTDANKIIQETKSEFGPINVEVTYQPS
ncbi:SpoIIIAH-like family protein [Saliterribacillus persicus]|uniref:Stage III sporulation protein AH n=1 Tax=Saliterribacillus persicus TaxID=930114 RepID=A0A368XDV6_9BACI|nr:SpoIIIAH-like family protein [Saliterribacillus persicus]RCW65406.1 stage III sporulation protein AH [Saliterribacillus persicus]